MSRNISSFFVAQGIVPEGDLEIYSYSFEILLATLVNFFALVLLSIISRTIPETALYILGFMPLRQAAGGYHAKNHLNCFLLLIFSYTLFLLLLFFLPLGSMLAVIIASVLLSVIFVLIFAPSEDSNKPLSKEEIIRLRKKSRHFIAGYAVVIGLLTVFIADKVFALSLALGVFTVAVSLIANFVKLENSKNKEICYAEKGGK